MQNAATRLRLHAMVLALVACCAVGVAPAAASTAEQRAIALDNQATFHVQRTFAACNANRSRPKPHMAFGTGTPSDAMLAALGVLRRTPTHEELTLALPFDPDLSMTIFRHFQRIVRIPGALEPIRISVGVGQMSVPVIDLPPCQRKVDRALNRMLRGQPKDVRRIALKIRRGFKLGPQASGPHLWLDFMGGGGTGGPFDARSFSKTGITMEGGGTNPPPPGFDPKSPDARQQLANLGSHWEVTGLVPDGVASVTLKHTKTGKVLGFGRVVQNAFWIKVPSMPTPGHHQTIVWRNAAGHVVNVIR